MCDVRLKKNDVIDFLGGTQGKAADVLGIKQSSVSNWPPILSEAVSDRVRGAAIRAGLVLPVHWVK